MVSNLLNSGTMCPKMGQGYPRRWDIGVESISILPWRSVSNSIPMPAPPLYCAIFLGVQNLALAQSYYVDQTSWCGGRIWTSSVESSSSWGWVSSFPSSRTHYYTCLSCHEQYNCRQSTNLANYAWRILSWSRSGRQIMEGPSSRSYRYLGLEWTLLTLGCFHQLSIVSQSLHCRTDLGQCSSLGRICRVTSMKISLRHVGTFIATVQNSTLAQKDWRLHCRQDVLIDHGTTQK